MLVSKPPAPEVAAEIEAYVASLATPVEFALLGPGRPDLTAAAEAVLRRLGRDVPTWPVACRGLRLGGPGSLLRGLFVGGTHCAEARIVVEAARGRLDGGHTFADFGDDAYTAGRAHPMIDPTMRLEHLARAAADEAPACCCSTSCSATAPSPTRPRCSRRRSRTYRQPVVVALVGTAADPQDRDRQAQQLVGAGAEVHLSNAGATRRAVELLRGGA